MINYQNKYNKKHVLFFLVLIPCLALTIFALLQPQRIQQFAQEFNTPPLFGCLQTGESNSTFCGTRLGKEDTIALKLHGRPFKNELVYYGDTLTGSYTYTSLGDQPIQIKSMGIEARSAEKASVVAFQPLKGPLTLEPKQQVSVDNASYTFTSPDPRGGWTVGALIVNTDGQILPVEKKTNIRVSSACTALRVKELTAKDKTNITTHCSKNPKSKLCTSRQYCEIFKGENCTQPNVSQETPGWECNTSVYMPKPEQDLLEELCKVYPDTDACDKFCERTVGTSLCPDKYLFIDTTTGKPVAKLNHPRAIYVRDPDGLNFTYAATYPKDKARIGSPKAQKTIRGKSVAGVKATKAVLLAQTCPPYYINKLGGGCELDPARPGIDCSVDGQSIGSDGRCCPGSNPDLKDSNICKKIVNPGPPPQCGIPGKPRCGLEKNILPPDPAKGRFVDPLNPGGSLTDPTKAQLGDFGYAPECASGRRDQNPTDDPADVEQFSCCASSLTLREGCCGQQCTVWSQKTKPDGTIDLRDGKGRICSNDPERSLQDNTCGRSREETTPPELRGSNPPAPDIPPSTEGSVAKKDIRCSRENPYFYSVNGVCTNVGYDQDGFRQGSSEPGHSCNKNGNHTIALPDGLKPGEYGFESVKLGACVPNENKCPTGQYDAVNDQEGCKDYCPIGKLPVAGTCTSKKDIPGNTELDCPSARPGDFFCPDADINQDTIDDQRNDPPLIDRARRPLLPDYSGREGEMCDKYNPASCISQFCLPANNELGGVCK